MPIEQNIILITKKENFVPMSFFLNKITMKEKQIEII